MELQKQSYLVLKAFLADGTSWKRNDVIDGPDWGPVRTTQLVEQRYIAPLVTGKESPASVPADVRQIIESLVAEVASLRERTEELGAKKRGRPRKTAAA